MRNRAVLRTWGAAFLFRVAQNYQKSYKNIGFFLVMCNKSVTFVLSKEMTTGDPENLKE